LHVNYLSFNSLIFRSTKKFVTSFVSIGSEVTSFFDFLKFAFCRCCYVASASLLSVQVAHWTKDQPATSDQSAAHSWQTRRIFEIASARRSDTHKPVTVTQSISTSENPLRHFVSIKTKAFPCAPFSVGSPPAQLSAALRVSPKRRDRSRRSASEPDVNLSVHPAPQ